MECLLYKYSVQSLYTYLLYQVQYKLNKHDPCFSETY